MTEQQIRDKFAQGFGIVKTWTGNGWTYYHDKSRSQRERKVLPVYEQPIPEATRRELDARRRDAEAAAEARHRRALSCREAAKAINRALGGRLQHTSASGSSYTRLHSGHLVRVADHYVPKLDGSGDVDRWHVQVIRAGRFGIQPEDVPGIINEVKEATR